VVGGAQQKGKYGAGNRTSSTYRGEERENRRSTNDSSMFSTECQFEKRNFDIDPINEFKLRTLNERYKMHLNKQKRKTKYCKRKKRFHDHVKRT